jgi:signal transduction histidine kinase
MLFSTFQAYYKIGTFIFALALLAAFQVAGMLNQVAGLLYALLIYIGLILIRLILIRKTIQPDFLIDVIAVSVIVFLSYGVHSYLTLFYLFPLFFSALLVSRRFSLALATIALFLYGGVFYFHDAFWSGNSIVNILLHAVSFYLIVVAAGQLHLRVETQARYIRELEDEKIRMAGYERLYRVSADLAHELRNPLAAISGAVQFMKEGQPAKEFVEIIASETSRLSRLVNDFLSYARPADAPLESVNLSEVVLYIVHRYEAKTLIDATIADNIVFMGSRVFLEGAFSNIIKNAVEAAKSKVVIWFGMGETLSAELSKPKKAIVLEVEDDGAGIDASVIERIFDPFFTTKTLGTGLGLAIAYRVITSYGGTITAGTSTLGGARFVVMLPLP